MTDPGTPQALRHLWASPALFVLGAFVAFSVVGSREAGWALGRTAVPVGADDGAVRDQRGVPRYRRGWPMIGT
ncbi:hypothetical protein GCM10009536_13530 [Streptomyces thermocarboxydus]